MDVIREMVRDVLAEEIGNLRRAGQIHAEQGVPRRQVREETVSIRSDADLHAFVARLLEQTPEPSLNHTLIFEK